MESDSAGSSLPLAVIACTFCNASRAQPHGFPRSAYWTPAGRRHELTRAHRQEGERRTGCNNTSLPAAAYAAAAVAAVYGFWAAVAATFTFWAAVAAVYAADTQ